MWLHEMIVEGAVLMNISVKTKEEALKEMVDALSRAGRLSHPEIALQDVLAREKTQSTGIGEGVGIPHTCTTSVHQPMIVYARISEGIEFQSIDGRPVTHVFLILGRMNGEALQLKILGHFAHLFHLPGFLEGLSRLDNPDSFVTYVREQEAVLGEIETPKDMPSVCVAGAGNGGLALAGHLALIGCRVHLFNRSEGRLTAVRMAGGVQVTGEVNGFAKLGIVTTDAREALTGVDLVMVVIPATGHRDMARLLGPHLTDGQVVVLNPGGTGGALEFADVLHQLNVNVYYFLAETETLIYACRISNPGQVRIFRIKNAVPVATFPAYHIPDILETLRKVLPYFIPGDNVLKTSLSNMSAVFHPALTIMNAAWIEGSKGDFEFYFEGASPSVAKVLEALDAERIRVAEALGVRVLTAREWLYQAYGVAGDNLYEAMQANDGYRGIKAPNTLDYRFITEDVPTSLVPLASLGEHLGVAVPTIKTIIHLSSVLHGVNYMVTGRTVERLGLSGLDVRQIRRLVEDGKRE